MIFSLDVLKHLYRVRKSLLYSPIESLGSKLRVFFVSPHLALQLPFPAAWVN